MAPTQLWLLQPSPWPWLSPMGLCTCLSLQLTKEVPSAPSLPAPARASPPLKAFFPPRVASFTSPPLMHFLLCLLPPICYQAVSLGAWAQRLWLQPWEAEGHGAASTVTSHTEVTWGSKRIGGKRDNTAHPAINKQKSNNYGQQQGCLLSSSSQKKGNHKHFRDKSSVIPTCSADP